MNPSEIIRGLEENWDPGIVICKDFLAQRGLTLLDHPETILARCTSESVTNASEAQFVLATILWTGMLGTVDRREAVKWCCQAAEAGYLPALTMLAGFYQSGAPGIAVDITQALRLLQQAASSGYAPAFGYLATAYLHGLGVHEDRKRGLAYLRQAAEAGHVLSQCELGVQLMQSGDSVLVVEGVQWLRAAADKGLSTAHNMLAEIFETGVPGVTPNHIEAERHREAARMLEED